VGEQEKENNNSEKEKKSENVLSIIEENR